MRSFFEQKRRLLIGAVLCVAGLLGMPNLASAAICPTTASTNSDCGFILTIGAGGSITGAAVPGAAPYDGADDALIGIVNESGSTYTGSFVLSGTGDGGGIFGFDFDGICTYIVCTFPAPTTYEGPLVSFSGISADGTTGTVNVTGLLDGQSTFFSLEGSPASIVAGGGVGVPSTVPEPGSTSLMLLGLAAVGLAAKRRARK